MPSIRSLIVFALSLAVNARPRRTLRSNESIASHVSDAQDGFTITAQHYDAKHKAFASNNISIDVIQARPAITPDTSIVLPDGSFITFGGSPNNMLETILVSDTTTSSGRSSLTIIAVDPITHETKGVMEHQDGQSIKIYQGGNGGVVSASKEEKMEMPSWECGVGRAEHLHHEGLEETEKRERNQRHDFKQHDRDYHHLEENYHHQREHKEYGHHHNHEEIEHHHSEHGEYDPSVSAIENLSKSLRGTKINPLNKQRILDSTLPYNYIVDLFIEIDSKFIEIAGGGIEDEAGITQSAYNYINTLVTAANVIYETEILTHLHVHSIKLSTLYDSSSSTHEALTNMQNNYGGNGWHTANVDLQHALLGHNLGGGIAYIGTLCNSNYGFGLTAGLTGDFTSLDQRVVWDLKAFMHEIGHSFSSGHTHDTNYYSPAIETCGNSCPSTAGNQWSTIMSYCHGCPGGYDNLMYTFGGIYDGSGEKSDLANWMAKPELVANQDSTHKNTDPHRVAYAMYSHVSSRGSCLFPPTPEVSMSFATYDSTLKVPKCENTVESCSSGELLHGRATLGPAEGGRSPNTLDTCTDGVSGSYHSDESLDSIKVSSTVGRILTAGDVAEIETTVYAYDPYADSLDLHYTNNPSDPTWTLIGTANPSGRGQQTIKMRYTLPVGEQQAVRAVFRYQGSASITTPFQCPSSGYDDIDDIVFQVSDGSPITTSPTRQPTSTSTLTCYNIRKIRLESTTGANIQIFELEALSSTVNIALWGTATQSSDWDYKFRASNVIDGDESTFSHTKDSNAHLEVDLGLSAIIDQVVIKNRWCRDSSDPHKCLCRLSDAKLVLLDNDDFILAEKNLGDTCGVLTITESFHSDPGC